MKTFKYIGLISLLIFSIVVSNKTKEVVKQTDNIMIQINKDYKKYNILKKESIIKDNTIIIGSNGKVVNINKSYDNMKKYGKYNTNLYIYDIDKVVIDKSKYIVGFNKVVLIFKTNKKIIDNGNYYYNNLINNKYCYSESLTNICKNNYTIVPNIVIKDNYLYNVKKVLTSNSIISFEVNDKLIEQLPFIINYINNRGYEIEVIDNLLK